jgi:hypothetical protein
LSKTLQQQGFLFLYLKMIQQQFAERVTGLVKNDPGIIGLAVAGSWTEQELDEFSDLDLVLVTVEKIGGNKEKMIAIARGWGDFISALQASMWASPGC